MNCEICSLPMNRISCDIMGYLCYCCRNYHYKPLNTKYDKKEIPVRLEMGFIPIQEILKKDNMFNYLFQYYEPITPEGP